MLRYFANPVARQPDNSPIPDRHRARLTAYRPSRIFAPEEKRLSKFLFSRIILSGPASKHVIRRGYRAGGTG